MKSMIRIASGQGFWGDLLRAPIDQVRCGHIDYLTMDYLAEVTMSIMRRQQLKNPAAGYARDFPDVIKEILPDIKQKGIKVISNAGGVNPIGCKDKILEYAKELGITGLKIAVIHGDNILDRIDELQQKGALLNNMETGEPISKVKDRLVSANVYYGARPIVEALKQGADIIVTGRVTDTGLVLAPMVYEFEWDMEDWDKMAAGTVAGHILECGAQSTGGNFTDWYTVEGFENIGFPICEAYPDGTFVITKHESLGGLVNEMTVKEQLLYEIGNPSEYITPDCIADFTSIQLEQVGKHRVRVFGIKGRPATPYYKVSCAYQDGWKSTATLTYSWPQAKSKALKAAEILKRRLQNLGFEFEEFRAELVGYNACHENVAKTIENEDDINEIQLRVSVRGKDLKAMDRFGKEIAPLILTGPSSVTGFAGGRPTPSEIMAYWPALIPKELCQPVIEMVDV
ncbi:MAG: acyclic terpene utilization AtuA family protein [Bacteroidia bacterium]|nr:acyclic terpene utilization AtuA family protein [Bacteroidia bacterium]